MREFVTAFAKLAPTQREALLLAVLEGLPYEVIAAHTGVSWAPSRAASRAPATRWSVCCSKATSSQRPQPARQPRCGTTIWPRRPTGAMDTSASPLRMLREDVV